MCVLVTCIDLPKAFTQDLTNIAVGLNNGIGAGTDANFSGRASANGSEDGVTSTATNSLSHGTGSCQRNTQSLRQESNLRPRDCWAGALSTQPSRRSDLIKGLLEQLFKI
ncbi:hypothetical protein EVAR_70402_1 [Eumeta japonica]|uniref:Uncharacterized protein n=1 Tax=Eumeta variegata TaxID=151549 RepID=A0A4C2AGG7_EUMVA|nr:hypothetical protein EVAR_70402_1 [Eumeta japonica]